MHRRGLVRFGDFLVVHFGKPVVRRDRAAVGEDQTADGIGDGGVFLDAPVEISEVAVHELFIVEQGLFGVAHFFALLAVEDVGLGNVRIAGFA